MTNSMNFIIPTFETKRLILREIKELDFPSWQQNFVDYEVIRNLSTAVPWPYPENGVREFYINMILPTLGKTQWIWGVFLKDQPSELIGCVHLWKDGRPEHRGFWLAKKYWSKGLMSEAVVPVIDYAFDILKFQRLVFANAKGNTGSRRIKEKTGAKLIDVRPAKFVDPRFTEHEIWELSSSDWKSFKADSSKSSFLGLPMRWKPYKILNTFWDAESDNLFPTKAFGIGWSINFHVLGRKVGLLKKRKRGAMP